MEKKNKETVKKADSNKNQDNIPKKDWSKIISDIVSRRNIGLQQNYTEYVHRLNDEELKKEYYTLLVRSDKSELILKMIIFAVYMGIMWKMMDFVLSIYQNSTRIQEYFQSNGQGGISIMSSFTILFIGLGLILTFLLSCMLFFLSIEKKRKLYVEGVLKERNLWSVVGGS